MAPAGIPLVAPLAPAFFCLRDGHPFLPIKEFLPFILEVSLKITPKECNSAVEDHFFWHSSWVGLIAGGKTYFPTLGERWGTGISHNVSHNKNKLSEGWTAEEVTFYFPFPEGETEFEITWLCTPAVKGSIKN